MPNSIDLSKYEARDFILDQTLQTRHRHHRMDPKMRRSALSQSRNAHSALNNAKRNCCISVRGAIKLHPFCTSSKQRVRHSLQNVTLKSFYLKCGLRFSLGALVSSERSGSVFQENTEPEQTELVTEPDTKPVW